jgi:hypothetical protein
LWSIFTSPLEPILARISDSDERLHAAAKRRLRLKRNFLYNSFLRASPKNSSKRKRQNFLLGSALTRGRRGFADDSRVKNFPPQTPPIFARSPKNEGDFYTKPLH